MFVFCSLINSVILCFLLELIIKRTNGNPSGSHELLCETKVLTHLLEIRPTICGSHVFGIRWTEPRSILPHDIIKIPEIHRSFVHVKFLIWKAP